MDEIAGILMALATHHKLPPDIVKRIGNLVVNAKRKTTDRVAEPRAPQGVAMMPDKTLTRRRNRYQELLKKIELPPDGFRTPAQFKMAANLSQTYRRLREREDERGVATPTPKDPRVDEAERLKSLFQRHGAVEAQPNH